jgi:transcription antitermination factor NusG
MGTQLINVGSSIEQFALPVDYVEPWWYAAYTSANHEKRVALQLAQRSVEHFLPLYESVRRWKDRRVKLQLPLFPGYVFVRMALQDRLQVLQVPGVTRLVGFHGEPTPLPEGEIEALREGLLQNLRVQPYRFLTVGRRVRVKTGPLSGFEGILVRRRGKCRFILTMDLIASSFRVDVDAADLEPVEGKVALTR